MRCCLEIAGRFGLLALVFLAALLLTVGIGAVTGGGAEETAELSPPPAPALVAWGGGGACRRSRPG